MIKAWISSQWLFCYTHNFSLPKAPLLHWIFFSTTPWYKRVFNHIGTLPIHRFEISWCKLLSLHSWFKNQENYSCLNFRILYSWWISYRWLFCWLILYSDKIFWVMWADIVQTILFFWQMNGKKIQTSFSMFQNWAPWALNSWVSKFSQPVALPSKPTVMIFWFLINSIVIGDICQQIVNRTALQMTKQQCWHKLKIWLLQTTKHLLGLLNAQEPFLKM